VAMRPANSAPVRPKFTPIIPPRTPWQDHEQPRSARRTTVT
jgi:hypothetical protein